MATKRSTAASSPAGSRAAGRAAPVPRATARAESFLRATVRAESFLRAAARDSRAAFFLDFDGTLADIVADPALARPVRGARAALRALVGAGARVVVISGRRAAFLRAHIGVPGVLYAGLYGAEERVGRRRWTDPVVGPERPAVARAAAALRRSFPRASVEDKGLSVVVHTRRARDPQAALRAALPVVRAVARAEGLGAIRRGKLVLEISARGVPDKGSTFRRICARESIRTAVVIGDDQGDLAMMDAAAEIVRTAFVIGVDSAESPRRLRQRADLMVASPADLVELLRDAAR